MKLHDVPNRTWVRVLEDPRTAPGSPLINKGDKIFFGHIDGMYSYCRNENNELVHLVAWAEVEIIEQ